MPDPLPPGGGPMNVPKARKSDLYRRDPDDDRDKYVLCAECHTRMFIGDHDFCPICKRTFCEECFEDHDCGFLRAQAEATDL